MILRELFYFDKDTKNPTHDDIYSPRYDDSIVNFDDTRKTRLTLRQINRARKANEIHKREKNKELEFVRTMYGTPPEGAEGGVM